MNETNKPWSRNLKRGAKCTYGTKINKPKLSVLPSSWTVFCFFGVKRAEIKFEQKRRSLSSQVRCAEKAKLRIVKVVDSSSFVWQTFMCDDSKNKI